MNQTLDLKNQYGEISLNRIIGGSSQVRAKFKVDNTNNKGITGLEALGISNVYMHTSTTPADGNPNPAAGYIVVEFEAGYSGFDNFGFASVAPLSGASLLVASAGLTAGLAYTISILGTTTQAQWELLGVPAGVPAALGLTFIAIATSCTGTGAVQVPATGGTAILSISPLGTPSAGLSVPLGQVILACYGAGGVFTGAAHSHSLLVKGGQAASTTNNIANYAGPLLGKQEATDATYPGGDVTHGGVQAATATGTLAGANVLGAPAAGTEIELSFSLVPLISAPVI